jgi:nitrogenase molybdenum-cofactor synthesis protein NifE
VIGTGEPFPSPSEIITPPSPSYLKRGESGDGGRDLKGGSEEVINVIGEYNIAGDLWLVEPVLRDAGIGILSRITGDATFEEITYAHRAKLNVVVCSRALINVAKAMEKKYGIPFVEVSFFGRTEMARALRLIVAKGIEYGAWGHELSASVEAVIAGEEKLLDEKLKAYGHLKGKKAVLYTGGVKSWSFISALTDLGIEIVAAGTKKSTFHDEEKMKEILGENAPLVEDVSPGNLLRLLKERKADILVAGGRNQYLGIKEGYPFVDVNQERHTAYAGYQGLLNLAEQISNGIRFYSHESGVRSRKAKTSGLRSCHCDTHSADAISLDRGLLRYARNDRQHNSVLINPLKHSQSVGAAIALQGIHNAIPVIHGAQGCTFLGKVLLTKHFREPIALASTKIFAEDVIMGSDENISKVIEGIIGKNSPDLIALLTSGLSEVRGDDVQAIVKKYRQNSAVNVVHIPTPDYEGGLETGYARAVEALIGTIDSSRSMLRAPCARGQVNVLAGSHLSPADFSELRDIIESFGLRPIILPDLSALDGSRKGISPLAVGGATMEEIALMGSSELTIALGASMERPAGLLRERFDIDYKVLESIAGLEGTDGLMATLSRVSGNPVPSRYERQRRVLRDGMRDAHFYFSGRRAGIALEPDLSLQTSRWLDEMGADVRTVVIPQPSKAAERITAESVVVGDLSSLDGGLDILISNSHAEDAAKDLGIPLYQTGFPVYKILGNNSKFSVGYRGSLTIINEVANLLMPQGSEHVAKEVCS